MSFFGINQASRALLAQQQALEVTGQNITNADVPGYSRQVAILRSISGPGAVGLDRSGNPIAPGGGIDVALVQRSHAAWMDQAAARLQAQVGQSSTADRTATSLEQLLAEPSDAGLSATVDRFLAAFGNLANRPDDAAARDSVVRAGQELAGRFNQLTSGIDSLRQDVITQARENISTVNDLAGQVAALSHEIGQAQAAGAAPNELLDRRDQLLQQIVQRTGGTVSGQQGSEVVVSLGGLSLVQGDHANALDLAPGSTLSVVLHDNGEPVTTAGGELGAEQEWADTVLPGYQARLAGIRDALAAAVNSLHQSGTDSTGAVGQSFFTVDASGTLGVNPVLTEDSRKVVAGDGSAGSGSIALAIANLSSAPGSAVPQYREWVAEIGSQSAASSRASDQAQASLQQIQAAQASESGVNLDEELAQMVSLQHAYAASARLLTTYDQMLTTLIQGTGG